MQMGGLAMCYYHVDCIRRIQWLEQIIQTHLPQVDLSAGPKLDGSSQAVLDSADAKSISTESTTVLKETVEAPSSLTNAPAAATSSSQSLDGATSEPQPDYWESPPGDSTIANEVRAVAHSLGQVSLHEDSRQTYYMGTSTGILFARLVGVVGASTFSIQSSPDSTPRKAPIAMHHATLEQLRATLRQLY
ncbi:hypothetical protein AbraIFM66950_006370 [Aspergillus brasiliensis]|nr:hypothetical protein AbraIFM66950_006370 [Aspergillus brasiliensis]